MIEEPLFSLSGAQDFDLERTGGIHVAVDQTFATAKRIQLDDTSWIDYVQGWLAGDGELMETLMKQASWEQRSRWMYTRMVTEPRLTAEYPVIADAPPAGPEPELLHRPPGRRRRPLRRVTSRQWRRTATTPKRSTGRTSTWTWATSSWPAATCCQARGSPTRPSAPSTRPRTTRSCCRTCTPARPRS